MSILTTVKSLYVRSLRAIPYHPELNKLIQNVAGTILLQQIYYYASQKDFKPFYKFNEPCEHKLYTSGDSWQEELAMRRVELSGAKAAIATKITTGMSKSEYRQVFIDGALAPVNRIVLYWTDTNRVTWYEFNEPLFLAHLTLMMNPDTPLDEIYNDLMREYPALSSYCTKPTVLGNVQNLHYLEMDGTYITSNTENTSNITTKNNLGVSTPKRKRPLVKVEMDESPKKQVDKKTRDFTSLEALVLKLNGSSSLAPSTVDMLNQPLKVYDRTSNTTIEIVPNQLYDDSSSSYRKWIDTSVIIWLDRFKHKTANRIALEKIKAAITDMNQYQKWMVDNNQFIWKNKQTTVIVDDTIGTWGE